MFLQQCPHCAQVNPTGSRFCNACGGPLDLAPCPHCGAINAAGDASCRDCGARLAAPGEAGPALRREREPPAQREASQRDGPFGNAMRREEAVPGPPRAPLHAATQHAVLPPGPRGRHGPRTAMTLIAGSLIAMAVLALGYAWTLRNTLEREGAAPAPSAPTAASPSIAPDATPVVHPATTAAPAPPSPPPAAAAHACPPAVDAMGLCRTYEASAARN